MWLFRGAQSAVFYYVTCTPCADSMGKRKRRKEAVRARSQREKQQSDDIVTDQPRPFQQPTPFSTNPGWMEEIALGPNGAKRRGGHRTNTTHHRIDSWDTGEYSAGSGEDYDRTVSHGSPQRLSKLGSRHLGDRWNRMLRYQREDEPLWGEEVEVKGSSVGISGQGKVDAKAPSKYCITRVPPVNDLHPPIVSGPKSRAETRWMLQPPPSARVMSGKDRSRTLAPPPTVEHRSMRMGSDKSTFRRSGHTHTLPPITTESSLESPDSPPTLPSRSPRTPESASQDLPRAPSPAFYAYGKDESHFVISSSVYSPSDSCSTLSSAHDSDPESPRDSLLSPATPISRPRSKDPSDHPNISRPAVSRALTSLHHDDKKNVHMLQFELPDPHDLEVGQVGRVRPFRWSMDF
ncbi:hypothetical protein BDW74DRAFT_163386 [Aspergillus multicolor]|uniref:uncharacterized protein n=1 Tax=Aspergillus multicolor TaxID=41759 RepID=UPI003CCD94C6